MSHLQQQLRILYVDSMRKTIQIQTKRYGHDGDGIVATLGAGVSGLRTLQEKGVFFGGVASGFRRCVKKIRAFFAGFYSP
jgi:hypothetical protein